MADLTFLRTTQAAPRKLLEQIQQSSGAARVLAYLRKTVPDVASIPQTTYTLYREFERNGQRDGFQRPHFQKRSQLARAVLEMILGDDSMRDAIHDLLWSICEETSWVLPAHEEQGPDFWELRPSPRQHPWGAHTALTREPDAIDLFAAETGASLAETVYLLGDRLAPEVCQRVRQEVERHIFKPYLAYGRKHWWYKGALNWNGVCNGSIGLAFLRLERDPQTLTEAIQQALEGLEAYIATGFEGDGGSIEGPGYWNYGLMYYVTLAEELRERSGGQLDLLAQPRLRDIAHYPLGMALAPGTYINFGDAVEQMAVEPGIVQRLAERTGVGDLASLILPLDRLEGMGVSAAKLAIMLRDAAWWDGKDRSFPASAREDFYLPECGVIKFNAEANGAPVALAAKAGHNDGHHSHADVGTLVYHVGGESLICDPGRGMYSREYFREQRYQNVFCNSYSHSVPRIAGQLQQPGPEFGGSRQYHGKIIAHGEEGAEKVFVIDLQPAYSAPDLLLARRTLRLNPASGVASLEDVFDFSGPPQDVEEAFATWAEVDIQGACAWINGKENRLELRLEEPAGAVFHVERLEEDCRANRREGVLSRISAALPAGSQRFKMRILPHPAKP